MLDLVPHKCMVRIHPWEGYQITAKAVSSTADCSCRESRKRTIKSKPPGSSILSMGKGDWTYYMYVWHRQSRYCLIFSLLIDVYCYVMTVVKTTSSKRSKCYGLQRL